MTRHDDSHLFKEQVERQLHFSVSIQQECVVVWWCVVLIIAKVVASHLTKLFEVCYELINIQTFKSYAFHV